MIDAPSRALAIHVLPAAISCASPSEPPFQVLGSISTEIFAGMSRGMWIGWWAALGLFVGSFLNVAIHRLPLEGETVSNPRRSRCPNCKTTLTWKENIPLLSWLVQRGRCRSCGWRIPWRYPLVEVLNSALWALVAWHNLPQQFGLAIFESIVMAGLIEIGRASCRERV